MLHTVVALSSSPTARKLKPPTPDGTGIRDYIHVADLAEAHTAAARRLIADPPPGLTGAVEARRDGVPARSAASADRIRQELGWTTRRDVREMVESAWAGWHR
ncbi:UDP-glucose 4-epimerase [Catenulispora sp. GP43]